MFSVYFNNHVRARVGVRRRRRRHRRRNAFRLLRQNRLR